MKNFREAINYLDINCDCWNMDHMIRVEYYDESDLSEDDMWGPDGFLYIFTSLNPDLPFFGRIISAIRYVFRMKPYRYSIFGEHILLPSDARNLTQLLQKYNDYIEKNNLFR